VFAKQTSLVLVNRHRPRRQAMFVKAFMSLKAFFISLAGAAVSFGLATAWVWLFRPQCLLAAGDCNQQEIVPDFIPAGIFGVWAVSIVLVALVNVLREPLAVFGRALAHAVGQVFRLLGLLLHMLIIKPLVFALSLLQAVLRRSGT